MCLFDLITDLEKWKPRVRVQSASGQRVRVAAAGVDDDRETLIDRLIAGER